MPAEEYIIAIAESIRESYCRAVAATSTSSTHPGTILMSNETGRAKHTLIPKYVCTHGKLSSPFPLSPSPEFFPPTTNNHNKQQCARRLVHHATWQGVTLVTTVYSTISFWNCMHLLNYSQHFYRRRKPRKDQPSWMMWQRIRQMILSCPSITEAGQHTRQVSSTLSSVKRCYIDVNHHVYQRLRVP